MTNNFYKDMLRWAKRDLRKQTLLVFFGASSERMKADLEKIEYCREKLAEIEKVTACPHNCTKFR